MYSIKKGNTYPFTQKPRFFSKKLKNFKFLVVYSLTFRNFREI